MPRVVALSPCDDGWVVENVESGKKVFFGLEEIASVFLELSKEEAVTPEKGVTIPVILMIGISVRDGNVEFSEEERDVVVILEDISAISEVVKAEETIVLFEVGPADVNGISSNVDGFMAKVVLGVIEDNKVEKIPTVVEELEESAGGEKAESLTDIEDISDTGLNVAIEGLLKISGCVVFEDLVISNEEVSKTLLEVEAVTLTGNEDF